MNFNFSQVHTEHSPGVTTFWAINLALVNFKKKWNHFKHLFWSQCSKIQFSSVAKLCPTLCNLMNHSTPGLLVHHQLLECTDSTENSTESVMPSNRPILCCLLLLPSIFPSIRVFSNESALHIRWLQYWSFSFRISPTNEHPGLISFRMDWLDLLAVQWFARVFSNTTVQKHQFFGAQVSL